jgi:hypothetical protein
VRDPRPLALADRELWAYCIKLISASKRPTAVDTSVSKDSDTRGAVLIQQNLKQPYLIDLRMLKEDLNDTDSWDER